MQTKILFAVIPALVAAENILDNLISGVGAGVDAIANLGDDIASGAANAFSHVTEGAVDGFSKATQGVANGIENVGDGIESGISRAKSDFSAGKNSDDEDGLDSSTSSASGMTVSMTALAAIVTFAQFF
ncbi:hypothetical protein LPJ66_011603 [Kickxella alabastrina]|uniref:Uncharacterized protein n=1 Tax=Kickxella alabastrina TaxID=61397 RepID=A0ACC1I1B8_9FUNG|nr:hypothetical protein LPJ66_011603 [Kickxella alabastrina]